MNSYVFDLYYGGVIAGPRTGLLPQNGQGVVHSSNGAVIGIGFDRAFPTTPAPRPLILLPNRR